MSSDKQFTGAGLIRIIREHSWTLMFRLNSGIQNRMQTKLQKTVEETKITMNKPKSGNWWVFVGFKRVLVEIQTTYRLKR